MWCDSLDYIFSFTWISCFVSGKNIQNKNLTPPEQVCIPINMRQTHQNLFQCKNDGLYNARTKKNDVYKSCKARFWRPFDNMATTKPKIDMGSFSSGQWMITNAILRVPNGSGSIKSAEKKL